jgi:hypothetical protein
MHPSPRPSRSPRMSTVLLAGALAAAGARAASDSPIDPSPLPLAEAGFSLKLPKAETVAYRGMVSYDAAGGKAAAILYPGVGGIAGLLVGIATHGAIVESAKNSEKTKLQQDADKVLDPYKEILGGFTNKDLMQQGMARLNAGGANKLVDAGDVADGWVIETFPVFSMTQDSSALVLENAVSIYAASDPTAVRYRNVVKVVSNVHEDANLPAHWSADQGRVLRDESTGLYAHSLRLAIQSASVGRAGEEAVEKTIRYSEGKDQRMERAQLLRESCGRAVIKTLRGWLMSVPLRRQTEQAATAPECGSAEPYPASMQPR